MGLPIPEFKEEYRKYSLECEAALHQLLTRITNLQRGMDASDARTLIAATQFRVKTFDSLVDKMKRNDLELTVENLHSIKDVAGIRVITLFEDDIYEVANALQNQSGLYVTRVKDYIENDDPELNRYTEYVRDNWKKMGQKESGYSSLHMTINVEVSFMNRKVIAPVEVQIRDKTMDAWASIEHVCGYKCLGQKSPKALKMFQRLASILANFRRQAMKLRDYE